MPKRTLVILPALAPAGGAVATCASEHTAQGTPACP